jgi:hypothetical protein
LIHLVLLSQSKNTEKTIGTPASTLLHTSKIFKLMQRSFKDSEYSILAQAALSLRSFLRRFLVAAVRPSIEDGSRWMN